MNDKLFAIILDKFRTVNFFMSGGGVKTIAESTKCHEALAKRLASPPFACKAYFVSPQQIELAATWTLVNPGKRKKNLGSFISNWYNSCLGKGETIKTGDDRWW